MERNIYKIGKELFITSDEEIKEGDYCVDGDDIYGPFEQGDIATVKFIKIILTTDEQLIRYGVQSIDDEFIEWFVNNPSCESVEVERIVNDYWKKLQLHYKFNYKIMIPKEEPKQDRTCTHNCSVVCGECQIFEPKQETLEEAAERYEETDFYTTPTVETSQMMIQRAFINGANWQAERMYSEEDMKNAFDSAREFNSLDGIVDVHIVLPMGGDMSDLQPLHFTFEEWFEQFKKKA